MRGENGFASLARQRLGMGTPKAVVCNTSCFPVIEGASEKDGADEERKREIERDRET